MLIRHYSLPNTARVKLLDLPPTLCWVILSSLKRYYSWERLKLIISR
mgnify:CR=1 FL=1